MLLSISNYESLSKLNSVHAMVTKYLLNKKELIGKVNGKKHFLVFPFLGSKPLVIASKETKELSIALELDTIFEIKNPSIENIEGIRFESPIIDCFVGGTNEINPNTITNFFPTNNSIMTKIEIDPYKFKKTQKKNAGISFLTKMTDWNSIIECYEHGCDFLRFIFFINETSFFKSKIVTKDGTFGRIYHLVSRSIWEPWTWAKRRISPLFLPLNIVLSKIDKLCSLIFSDNIYELHFPEIVGNNDPIYAYQLGLTFAGFESEFDQCYKMKSKLEFNNNSEIAINKIKNLLKIASSKEEKNEYSRFISSVTKPTLSDKFRFFFSKENVLVRYVLNCLFLKEIPKDELIRIYCRIRNDFAHGNKTKQPPDKFNQMFTALRCFIYIIQFKKCKYKNSEIKIMLNELFNLEPEKRICEYFTCNKEKKKGMIIVHWKSTIGWPFSRNN